MQGNFKKIQRIDVANNLLARVPPSMGHLKLLKEFNLRYNSLDDRCAADAKADARSSHARAAMMGGFPGRGRGERVCAHGGSGMPSPRVCLHMRCRYKAKAEEGLSRLLAFLREEEERERLEEIERLKPIGTPVGAYLEYRCAAHALSCCPADGGRSAIWGPD